MKRQDYTAETDLDDLADIAFGIAERVRDENPNTVRSHLIGLCERHPVKAAQVLMVLAVWFDPEITTGQLWERVNRAAESRVKAVTLERTA